MNSGQPSHPTIYRRAVVFAALVVVLTLVSTRLRADTGMCGGASIALPFTDVSASNIFFCAIASAYFSGLTNGTSPTTYSPSANVPREQMAAFVSRTLDQSLRRGSRRAALNQWWTPTQFSFRAGIPIGSEPRSVACDGADLWVANQGFGTVTRVRASDGSTIQTWTGAAAAARVLVARGQVYITSDAGRLYIIFPATSGNILPVTLVTDQLGGIPRGIAYDGAALWTANSDFDSSGGSVSHVLNGAVTTVSTGFVSPWGVLYDGDNIWVTDLGDDELKKLNVDATILASVPVDSNPAQPVFDGTNIWVPSTSSNTVTVVRVKDTAGNPLSQPFVLATLTGNGLNGPWTTAFDGQRILVVNLGGNSVSLWKATDLTPLGSVSTGADSAPQWACSDGVNFWVVVSGTAPPQLLRF